MNQLVAMRAFVEIADRGSLTAAAASLGRSLPTMVRILAGLEEHLGARLLQRTTRRMSLTEEGRDYLSRCRHILADVEEAERAVSRRHSQPRGNLRISAPVLFGQRHVAPPIVRFLQRNQRVQIELLLLDRMVDLVDEGIDLAVRIGHLSDSSMVAIPVGNMPRVVCAAPELLQREGIPDHPAELSSRGCVRFQGLGRVQAWWFREDGRDLNVPVKGAFSCTQAAAAAEACAEGLGFGQFLAYQVQPLLCSGRLQRVLQAFERPPLPISLVYPESRLVSSRLRALIDWLRLELRGLRFDQSSTQDNAG